MPQEKKKRGRRAQDKKRKLEEADDTSNKRSRHSHDAHPPADSVIASYEQEEQEIGDGSLEGAFQRPSDMPFYGLLDEEEQEYFRRADEMLELDDFSSPEDRETFLNSVYKEAEGKELKMANSQSCSRLMERLIQSSNTAQLKALFQKYAGHFLYLFQHRFASHCCEALFIQAAPVVTIEIKSPPEANLDEPEEKPVVMEDLFMQTITELDGFLGFLITDRFASHTLRVLLAVLGGQPLDRTGGPSVFRSKKKENVSVARASQGDAIALEKRVVPDSFKDALDKFVAQSTSGFDTPFLQSLAMHPTGNPTLQLLLQLELTVFGKQRAKDEASLLHKLLPDEQFTEESASGKFVNGCMYDPLGSRLLETIITHAPGKHFRSIYKNLIKSRIATLARNDTASYVVVVVLNRLGKEDLQDATTALVAQMQTLVNHNRTVVIRSLIERCSIRHVDPSPIVAALAEAYRGPNGFDIAQLLKPSNATAEPGSDQEIQQQHYVNRDASTRAQQSFEKLHGSLLAQAMIAVPGDMGNLIFDSLARLGTPLSLRIAQDPNASRTLQAALTSSNATVIARRKIIQQFYGHIGEMALHPSASRVIDAIWIGTQGLTFIRERIAEELAENEAALRESHVGRAVWRNWKMDMYKRKRRDWVAESRASAGNEAFVPFPEELGDGEENTEAVTNGGSHASAAAAAAGKENGKHESRHMTAIERARLKHAERKKQKQQTRAAQSEAKSTKTSGQKGSRDDAEEFEGPAVAVAPVQDDDLRATASENSKRRESVVVDAIATTE